MCTNIVRQIEKTNWIVQRLKAWRSAKFVVLIKNLCCLQIMQKKSLLTLFPRKTGDFISSSCSQTPQWQRCENLWIRCLNELLSFLCKHIRENVTPQSCISHIKSDDSLCSLRPSQSSWSCITTAKQVKGWITVTSCQAYTKTFWKSCSKS